jgi:hypothetical protein
LQAVQNPAGSMSKYLFTLLALCGYLFTEAQVPGRNVRGMVQDQSGKRGIAFAELYNESLRRGIICDSTGRYWITASPGDTLVATSFGYLGRVVIVDSSFYRAGGVIRLQPQPMEIGEVNVITFTDYDDFKKQFLALQLPHTRTDLLRDNLAALSRQNGRVAADEETARRATSRTNLDFATVSVPIYSRYDRQMQNYNEVLKKEERQRVIDKKYNRDIIYKVTRLPQDEITEFMGFCHFSEEYLYKASSYDILVSIENKFKEYKRMKEAGKSELLPEQSEYNALA